MKVTVVGLGYVGSVCAGCLAAGGHEVNGVDVNPLKAELIGSGRAPVLEPGLDALMGEAVAAGRLRASTDLRAAVAASDISLICVGTPSRNDGGLETSALERVCIELAPVLPRSGVPHTVVFRSTMLPGTCEGLLVPLLEEFSGLTAGEGFDVCVNPEFLREGSSVADFNNPPKTVIGETRAGGGDAVAGLFDVQPGPKYRVPIAVAELTKYVDNSFHALKVGFANEIGAIAQGLGVDSHEVMEIFCKDTKLNISPAYLKPGFSFGGSCLPKDLRAITHHAQSSHVSVPILDSILLSNEHHLRRAFQLVTEEGRRRIGMFGIAFKAGTDELRESPYVELAELLIGKGYDLKIYDPCVQLSRLTGTNLEYIESHLPHVGGLLARSPEEVLEHAEVCILATRDDQVVELLERVDDRRVVDLVRPRRREGQEGAVYQGVAW